MKRNVVIERVYPFSPDEIWDALTNPESLADWMMETDFQPYVGHHFTFRTAPAPGFDGVVYCEVIMVDKPRKLAYTWKGGNVNQTVVTWELHPVAEGTKLRLEHTGFDGLASIAVSFILGYGWRKMLNETLADLIRKRQHVRG